MQVGVLCESDFSDGIPEFHFIITSNSLFFTAVIQRIQNIGLKTGAAEIYACAYIIVGHIELPAADFLQVTLAVANTGVPSVIFAHVVRSGGVLPVFTEYTEVADRYYETDTPDVIVYPSRCIAFYIGDVVCIEVESTEICISLCIESILIINICTLIIRIFSIIYVKSGMTSRVELAIAHCEVDFTELSSDLRTVHAIGAAIEPAALVAEAVAEAAEGDIP